MEREIYGLQDKNCWEYVHRHDVKIGATIMRCNWVYKCKMANGTCYEKKSRICIDGSNMNSDDYDANEVSSPVADRCSIRMLLSVAALRCLKIESIDITQAYIAQKLPNKAPNYMYAPRGFERKDRVLRILRPLYGLPASGHALYTSLSDWLQRIGLVKCKSDPTMYIFRRGED